MEMGFVFTKLLMMFAAIAAAFLAVRCGLWDKSGNKVLSNAVTFVLNPCTMIVSAISGDRPLSNMQVLELTAIAALCYLFLILSAYAIPRLLRVPQEDSRLYRFMYIFSNVSFFGLPIVKALFGDAAAFLVVIFVLPFQLLIFTYGITLIAGGQHRTKFSPKMLTHPMILSCLAAYILYLSGVKVPGAILEPLAFLGQATSPIAMMVVGGSLAYAPLKKMFLSWRLYGLSLIKMILVPTLVYLVLHNLLPDTETNALIIGVSVVIMAMPTAATTTILANQYGGDVDTAASSVCLTTLLSAGAIPFLMWLLTR